MALQLTLSDLTRLEKIQSALERNDPRRQFAPLGMHRLIIAEGAVDDLIETVERQLARVGRDVGRKTRIRLIADSVPIMRAGQNLKDLVFSRLAERFEVTRVTLDDGHPTLHADETMLDRATAEAVGADCIVSVGGGTITDIAKIAAMRNSTPVHVVVQTAASVDGFTDNFSVVLQKGVKRTLLTRWPDAVLTDCRTIAEAPHALNASGFGELLSLYCAPGDWFLASKCAMDNSFTPVLVELLALCGEGIQEWSVGVGQGHIEGCQRWASALAMRGIVTGVGGTSASLSGMEHLISHMLDIHSAESGAATGLHGAQVGVASVISAAAWEVFCERMAETPPDLGRLFERADAREGEVKAAFATLDRSGRVGAECWTHYQKKLTKWGDNRHVVAAFLKDWPAIRDQRHALVLSSHGIAACLHQAKAPMRAADLRPAVSAGLLRWAVANCQFMRERFTVADLLTFAGWWDDEGVTRVLARSEAACAAAEATKP